MNLLLLLVFALPVVSRGFRVNKGDLLRDLVEALEKRNLAEGSSTEIAPSKEELYKNSQFFDQPGPFSAVTPSPICSHHKDPRLILRGNIEATCALLAFHESMDKTAEAADDTEEQFPWKPVLNHLYELCNEIAMKSGQESFFFNILQLIGQKERTREKKQ